MISLYFHIPFCTKKCPYCHFYVIPNKKIFHSLLADGLQREWDLRKNELASQKIVSVYFGGGTPSLFGPDPISRILERIQLDQNVEITLEANPEESSKELFASYRSIGINRISLGVQSLDDRSLQTLERLHSAEKAKSAIFAAHDAGFTNISIDVMYDLPNQTRSSFRYTLDQIEKLPISHVSLYNLTIEPETVFYKRKENLSSQIPPPETSAQLLQDAVEALEKAKLSRYEISAFGKPSIHNSGYWTGRPFLGFGPSAFSYWDGERFQNVKNIQRYAKTLQNGEIPIDFREKLPYPQNIKERLAINLRLREGVDLASWTIPPDTMETLMRLQKEGLLCQKGSQWSLSEKGMLFYDTVAAELV